MIIKIIKYLNTVVSIFIATICVVFCLISNADTTATYLNFHDKPSIKNIEFALTKYVGKNFSIEQFMIEATENLGDSVDPIWKMRFRAKLIIKSELYKGHIIDNNIIFIEKSHTMNDIVNIYGRIRSEIFKGEWDHKFNIDGDLSEEYGHNMEKFGLESVLARSHDEAEYYENKEKQERQLAIKLEQLKLEREKLEIEMEERKRAREVFTEHIPRIRDKVTNAWIRPGTVYPGAKAKVVVQVDTDGNVIDTKIESNSGGDIFGRSVIHAINKASPLPIPDDPMLYKYYKSFVFNFDPPG